VDGLINRRSGIHGYYLEWILSDGASLLDGKISTTFGDKSLQTIEIIAPNCFDLTVIGRCSGKRWIPNGDGPHLKQVRLAAGQLDTVRRI
jgi:hypothetical protein